MSKGDIASIVWTVLLILAAGAFLVIMPYSAIIESSLAFWLVVCGGLTVSFICSASELAFGLACGENSGSAIYKKNSRISLQQNQIAESASSEEVKLEARNKAAAAQRLTQIGESYATHYNPTLVVTNNVANIVVAVISASAMFAIPQPQNVGVACPWLSSWALRCHDWGLFVPFPVNSEVFQSALALTLILVVGEIIPKQIATAFPERVTHLLYPVAYRCIWIFSLGAGPAFGVLGQRTERLLRWARPSWN